MLAFDMQKPRASREISRLMATFVLLATVPSDDRLGHAACGER